jgi:Kae1-associated kinase Bud32
MTASGEEEGKLIGIGAEARIYSGDWRGRKAVIKHRVPKGYRHKEIDDRLRQGRTKGEARLLAMARDAGVRTPIIYDVDVKACTIVMEQVEGTPLKEVLESEGEEDTKAEVLRIVGREAARLHRADIVHGDLTGANLIYRDGTVQFIDFGLGERTPEVEAKGVDLHVLEEALKAINLEHLFESVEQGYLEEWPAGKEVVDRVKDIAKRGRYT